MIPYLARECSCPTEHTIAKLGHCDTCDWSGIDCAENDAPSEADHKLRQFGGMMVHRCPPAHSDGTSHDFNWATYADEDETHGVCRCGLSAVDYDLMAPAPGGMP